MAGVERREGIRDRGDEIVRRDLEQREIVRQSKTATKRVRRDQQRTVEASRPLRTERSSAASKPEPDYNSPPPDYPVEIWDSKE